MILQIFVVGLFLAFCRAASFSLRPRNSPIPDAQEETILHSVTNLLTIQVPASVDQRMMLLEDFVPFVNRLAAIVDDLESTPIGFECMLSTRPEFLTMSLRRFLSHRIVVTALRLANDKTLGRDRFSLVKERLSLLPSLATIIPWEFEPHMMNHKDLDAYENVMFKCVSLAFHLDNNDIVQALDAFDFGIRSPKPLVFSIKDGDYHSVVKMLQMGGSLHAPIVWEALISAPAGENNRKFAYIDHFLKNGYMKVDDVMLGKGWIDYALLSKTECMNFIVFMVRRGAKCHSLAVYRNFLKDETKSRAYRFKVHTTLKNDLASK